MHSLIKLSVIMILAKLWTQGLLETLPNSVTLLQFSVTLNPALSNKKSGAVVARFWLLCDEVALSYNLS